MSVNCASSAVDATTKLLSPSDRTLRAPTPDPQTTQPTPRRSDISEFSAAALQLLAAEEGRQS